MNLKVFLIATALVLAFVEPDCSAAWTWNYPTAKTKSRKIELEKVNDVVNKFRRKQFEKYSRPQMYSIMTRVGKRSLHDEPFFIRSNLNVQKSRID
jgi:hypothetical protein